MSERLGSVAHRLRVLVVDDHPLMRAGAHSIVQGQNDLEICGEASSSAEAIDAAARTRPDVILLDLRLGGTTEDGIELAAMLVGLVPESRVLVYSGYPVQRSVSELVRIGVAGFLPKTVHPHALVLAIRTVVAGGRVFSPEVMERIGSLAAESNGRTFHSAAPQLTVRELRAIQLIADGLDNGRLAVRLSLSPSSVRLCLTSAFAKLGARNRTEAVTRAHRMGLISID